MRRLTKLWLCIFLICSIGNCQENSSSSKAATPIPKSDGYTVSLTELRLRKPLTHDQLAESLKKTEELKNNEDFEIVETIRLSTLPGFESIVQVGRKTAITVGVSEVPGRAGQKSIKSESFGTIVRLTAVPIEGKTRLTLNYESSRVDSESKNELSPDTKTFLIDTTLLLEPSKTVLVGGSTVDGSTYLAVSLK